MARQSIGLLVCLGVLLAGCADDRAYQGVLNMPTAAAVLHPEDGGPFREPVGFVANGHGGLVTLLDLKQGRFLTDAPTASFFRSAPLATGAERLLSSLAVYATDTEIHLFATDKAYNQLIRIPYMTDQDAYGGVTRHPTSATTPVFTGQSDVTISDVYVQPGRTSTEDWVVEYENGAWMVRGTRSGPLGTAAVPGVYYTSPDGSLGFLIEGRAEDGDRFDFQTDNGIDEVPVDGTPTSVSIAPDQSLLAVITTTPTGGALRWYDPETITPVGETNFGVVVQPSRMSWSEDGETLWVADSLTATLWEVDRNDPTIPTAHPLPWPIRDVAELNGEFGHNLYLTSIGEEALWLYDPVAQSLVDLNPWTDAIDGHWFPSPIMGIEAMKLPYRYPEADESSVHRFGRSVAISLHAGGVVFLDEETGCLVRDLEGPRTQLQGSYGVSDDYETNFEGAGNAALMTQNALDTRHVIVNSCAGIPKSEIWTLRYVEPEQAWHVEGSLSGPQTLVAREDQRYTSDHGEVSFVIRAGTNPSENGWKIQFRVYDGVLTARGDNNGDNQRDVRLEIPSDPIYFHYRVGPDGNGWKKVDDRPFVLVLGQGSDLVGRVKPQSGEIEVSWE